MLYRYMQIRHKTETVVQLYAYSTAALEGGGSSAPSSGCFAPWTQTQYPLYTKQDEPRNRSGWARKILPISSFESQTVQPSTGRYSDNVFPVNNVNSFTRKLDILNSAWVQGNKWICWKNKEWNHWRFYLVLHADSVQHHSGNFKVNKYISENF
jgi:hypothetical protein